MNGNAAGTERAITWRGALTALALVLLWSLAVLFMVSREGILHWHLLFLVGFCAILTVFLLQFRRLFLVSVVVIYVGLWVLLFRQATPDDYGRLTVGLLVSLPVAAMLAGLAAWLHFRPLARSELVIIYSCVLIAIPWTITLKGVFESSTCNLCQIIRKGEPDRKSVV